jgi:hypothetical protein
MKKVWVYVDGYRETKKYVARENSVGTPEKKE